MNNSRRNYILIVDDADFNRLLLSDMLKEDYKIIEAKNGIEAMEILHQQGDCISLVLLDLVMPEMDGFQVLQCMRNEKMEEKIPVIIISSENSAHIIQKGYELGAIDYISRPFNEMIVKRRVINTIRLYTRQRTLISMIGKQMYTNERNNMMMINILSHIVEVRNGESGVHVLNIKAITELILRRLKKKDPSYHLDEHKIMVISNAAAFHDIGKILIPEEILNKPGKLTPEEYEIMKTHALKGADMLLSIPVQNEEDLIKSAYEICRWHHERYDGSGYPDGLKEEEIPISAQVVSIADVYDALTSERVYKKAIPHRKALKMILDGECGYFNPILTECLIEEAGNIQEALNIQKLMKKDEKDFHNMAANLISQI